MEQVKIFAGNSATCEDRINRWLQEKRGDIDIVRVLQSSVVITADNGVDNEVLHISIFYEKLWKLSGIAESF